MEGIEIIAIKENYLLIEIGGHWTGRKF